MKRPCLTLKKKRKGKATLGCIDNDLPRSWEVIVLLYPVLVRLYFDQYLQLGGPPPFLMKMLTKQSISKGGWPCSSKARSGVTLAVMPSLHSMPLLMLSFSAQNVSLLSYLFIFLASLFTWLTPDHSSGYSSSIPSSGTHSLTWVKCLFVPLRAPWLWFVL